MVKETEITKEMTISEVVEKYPGIAHLLIEHGLHCVGCPLAQRETIEQAAEVHRVNLEKLLQDLNEKISK